MGVQAQFETLNSHNRLNSQDLRTFIYLFARDSIFKSRYISFIFQGPFAVELMALKMWHHVDGFILVMG